MASGNWKHFQTIETIPKIIKWIYSSTHAIKIEYVNIVFHVFILFFKNKHPKITVAEINVIIGVSLTKILNIISEIVYKTDCIAVILREYFLKLLNREKAKNPLIKYLITSINIRSK